MKLCNDFLDWFPNNVDGCQNVCGLREQTMGFSLKADSGKDSPLLELSYRTFPWLLISSILLAVHPFHLQIAQAADSPSMTSEALLEDIEFLQEETVSIAVLHEQPISDAPSNVYVITDEDIRQSGAIDLPTVLRRIPGIEVMQMTGADFNVSVRGDNQLQANKLLIMVDGRSIYLDMQGEVLWKALPITLPEIKRIEVLKGPASALYGFNAFDGIINIITKSPEEMEGVTIQAGGGEYGTLSSAAILAGKHEKLAYRLSVGQDQTNQWEDRNALAYRSTKFNGQFDYALPSQAKLTVSGGYLDSNAFDGHIVDTLEIAQKPSIGYALIGYEQSNFFIRGWWTQYTQPQIDAVNSLISNVFSITDKNGSTTQNIIAQTVNLDAQDAVDIGLGNRFTYGLNYRHNQVKSNFLDGDGHEDRLGLYIQDELKINPLVTAVGGIRLDMGTFINPTYSPRISFVFKPVRDHTFRASIAQAFRSPTIFETRTLSLAQFITPPLPSTVLTGSPNLVPEEITSYEFGYQGWYLKHRLRTRIDIFFNHISNLIGRSATPGSTTSFSFFNGASSVSGKGSADIYGVEAGVEFLATTWLTGFTNLSYQDIGQTYPNSNRVQRGAPRFKINGGLRAETENGLSGEITLNFVGSARYSIDPAFQSFALPPFPGSPAPENKIGSYFLLNIRGAYGFWKVNGKNKAEMAFSVFNALNDKHKEHPLGENIGSRVLGWLTLYF